MKGEGRGGGAVGQKEIHCRLDLSVIIYILKFIVL
jgi:hypothetical protein